MALMSVTGINEIRTDMYWKRDQLSQTDQEIGAITSSVSDFVRNGLHNGVPALPSAVTNTLVVGIYACSKIKHREMGNCFFISVTWTTLS